MKLFWGPHTCAIGIHVLLEEIGKPYEAVKMDVLGGETHKPPFQAINPKEKVPTLVRDDGSVLTEFGAIATWLARTNPDKALLPEGVEQEVRAIEIMDYAVATVHMQAFARVFAPEKFEPKDVVHGTLGLGQGSVKEEGRTMLNQAFAVLNTGLAGKPYAGGERFSIADAALFYVERWAPLVHMELPPNLAAHLARMKARPAVQRVLAAEGEH